MPQVTWYPEDVKKNIPRRQAQTFAQMLRTYFPGNPVADRLAAKLAGHPGGPLSLDDEEHCVFVGMRTAVLALDPRTSGVELHRAVVEGIQKRRAVRDRHAELLDRFAYCAVEAARGIEEKHPGITGCAVLIDAPDERGAAFCRIFQVEPPAVGKVLPIEFERLDLVNAIRHLDDEDLAEQVASAVVPEGSILVVAFSRGLPAVYIVDPDTVIVDQTTAEVT